MRSAQLKKQVIVSFYDLDRNMLGLNIAKLLLRYSMTPELLAGVSATACGSELIRSSVGKSSGISMSDIERQQTNYRSVRWAVLCVYRTEVIPIRQDFEDRFPRLLRSAVERRCKLRSYPSSVLRSEHDISSSIPQARIYEQLVEGLFSKWQTRTYRWRWHGDVTNLWRLASVCAKWWWSMGTSCERQTATILVFNRAMFFLSSSTL